MSVTALGQSLAAEETAAACVRQTLADRATPVTTAGTVTESVVQNVGGIRSADIQLKVTAAATEAGDTLDVFVDTSYDGGTSWVNLVHFPQVLGTGGAKTFVARVGQPAPATAPVDVSADAAANTVRNGLGIGDRLRVRHTTVDVATGGNMSFAFTVKALLKS